ncbi:MAG: competence type IV pilus major pilin ComGC [Phycisphaerae bacterium]
MNRKNAAFALVELLIVVTIIGILAALVIPQFTEASYEAKNSALSSDLHTLRSQCELFKLQHQHRYPHQMPGVTDGPTFMAVLMGKTNSDGTTTGTPAFGPYLKEWPTNEFVVGAAGGQLTLGNTAGLAGCTTGWYFDITQGKMSAGDPAHRGL